MSKHIREIEFTLFDTETTGLDARSGDRIVEIAGLRFKNGGRIAVFEELVNPGRPISEAAFQVNKITPEMLRSAPRIEEVLPRFLDFIRGSCLCSYNAGFDLGFLNQELRATGQAPLEDEVVVDVLKMARRLLPGLERYALWFVAQHMGLKTQQSHRALADVQLTWEVFNRLTIILEKKGLLDFAHFSQLFSINPGYLENLTAQKRVQIQEAMALGVRLKIKYLSTSGLEVTERQVIPREIKQEAGGSYLIGFCCLRNDERTFRIDHILNLEVMNGSEENKIAL